MSLLIHSLVHPDGLLPPPVLLLPLQVFGYMQLRMQRHETPQLQDLSALIKTPHLMTLNRPFRTHSTRDLTPVMRKLELVHCICSCYG